MDLKSTLKELCECRGVSGCEDGIAEYAVGLMSRFGETYTDKRGNVICRKKGSGKHILLDAHMDQIGFVVTDIDSQGFVKVSKSGGTDMRIVSGQEVEILGKRLVYGIVSCKPPHLTNEKERNKAVNIKDVAIDTGLGKEEAEKLISPGDRVIFRTAFAELLNSRVTCPAIDNRAGMLITARAMELIEQNSSSANITAVFSVQEETGGNGAANAAYAIDADEAIVIDVSFAVQPGVDKGHAMDMGGGVFIGFGPVLNRGMSKKLKQLAKENDIPFASEVVSGRTGTNADGIAVSKCGVKTAMISPPIRNMHTCAEIVDLADIEAAAKLIALYAESEGEE